MLAEFASEESNGNPYRSRVLSGPGLAAFAELMRETLQHGDEVSLGRSLSNPAFWVATETYERNGVVRERRINVQQAAERLSITEFNTWYVRGLASRLLREGVASCEVYRAAQPKWEPAECTTHEGKQYPVRDIYAGHRARYWPEPGDMSVFSIPFGPGCHHTIRRLRKITLRQPCTG
jgi:hypothetical protein